MTMPHRSLRAFFSPSLRSSICALLAIACAQAMTAAIAQTMPFAPPSSPSADPNRDAQEVSALLRAKRTDAAAVKVGAMLARNPKDAQARFLNGLVLTDQGKTADAIKSFRTLTEDYPELPEPYNNLASLYAAAGQLDKARTALEAAIAANPSYVIGYENLGDLYARMASQAYDKGLQLDRSNAAIRAKASSLKGAIAPGPALTSPAPAPAATLPGR